jgi:hypothetical protein
MLFGKYIDQQGALQIKRGEQSKREIVLQEAEFLRKKLEFETRRHERKDELLKEAARLAARIANVSEPHENDLIRFDELYFADLIGVEKRLGPVESAMVCFSRKLKGQPPEGCPQKELPDLSLSLSRAVREELKESEDALLGQQREISELVKPKP